MNAFTIPKKSVMAKEPPPFPGNKESSKHWRNLPVIGSKQGEKERLFRAKLVKSSI